MGELDTRQARTLLSRKACRIADEKTHSPSCGTNGGEAQHETTSALTKQHQNCSKCAVSDKRYPHLNLLVTVEESPPGDGVPEQRWTQTLFEQDKRQHQTPVSAMEIPVVLCVVSSHLLWTPVYTKQHMWAHQPGSHRRKVSAGKTCIFSPPFFCGARLNNYREKDSAVPVPRRLRVEFCSVANQWAAYVCICCEDVLAIFQKPCVKSSTRTIDNKRPNLHFGHHLCVASSRQCWY